MFVTTLLAQVVYSFASSHPSAVHIAMVRRRRASTEPDTDKAKGKAKAKHRTGQTAGTDRCKAGKGSKGRSKQPAGKTGEVMDKAEGRKSATAQSTLKRPAAAAAKRLKHETNTVKGDQRSNMHDEDMSVRPAAKRLKLDMPDRLEDDPLLVRCTRCKCYTPRTKCQVDSKHNATFKCNVCNSKMVSLNRTFGRWPIEDFSDLDDEEQRLFYMDIKAMKGRDLKTFVKEKFSNFYKKLDEEIHLHAWEDRRANSKGNFIVTSQGRIQFYKERPKGPEKTRWNKAKRALEVATTAPVHNMIAAKKALSAIGDTFEVMHGLFKTLGYHVLGQWGVNAFNALRHVHTCAEATIESKGMQVFPYPFKCMKPKLRAAKKAIKALKACCLKPEALH